jgi:hypothetical protein
MINKYNRFIKESEETNKEEKKLDFLQAIIDGKVKTEESDNTKTKEYWVNLIKNEKNKLKKIDLLKKYLLVSSTEEVNNLSKELGIGFFVKDKK